MGKLLYQDRPKYSIWLKIVMWFTLALILFSALVSYQSGSEDVVAMIVTVVFIIFVFWAVMPRRYCIYESKVKVEMGKPFSITIRFDNIKYAGEPRGRVTFGMNFVTTFGNIVEIDRKKGLTVNISPGDREVFLDNLNRALEKWRGEHPAI